MSPVDVEGGPKDVAGPHNVQAVQVTGRCPTPQSKDTWTEFMTRYAQGEFHTFQFPSRSKPGSERGTIGSNGRATSVGSQVGEVGSTLTGASAATPPSPLIGTASRVIEASDRPFVQPRLPSIIEPHPAASVSGKAPIYQDQSEGPTNQDPDIPDIGAANLPEEERQSSMFSADEKRQPQQDLTLQHVRQLNADQRAVTAAQRSKNMERAERDWQRQRAQAQNDERHEGDREAGASGPSRSRERGSEGDDKHEAGDGVHADIGDPGPSSATYRQYRRPPQDAELAPIARRMSHGSSPSDEEGHGGYKRDIGGIKGAGSAVSPKGTSEVKTTEKAPKDGHSTPARNPSPPPGLPHPPPQRPRAPRSRASVRSRNSRDEELPIESVLESTTNSSVHSHPDIDFDYAAEQKRVREFFDAHGYLPAPRQPPEATRRRLRVIRRLGLERPDRQHRTVVDRFTRLAVSIFKTKCAVVSVIGRDKQIFLSQIGFGNAKSASFEESFCCHSILGGAPNCMVIPDAAEDWRFENNPFVKKGEGPMQFYAGAPLYVGRGSKPAVIGTMCVIDDKKRDNFGPGEIRLLQDLAECAVSELELLYNQRSTVETAKLHQVSVDFLRRSLKHRPKERAGQLAGSTASGTVAGGERRAEGRGRGEGVHPNPDLQSSNSASSGQKRRSGADAEQNASQIDIFDEACAEIRHALKADAVAIVDLSQFHLFYPTFQSSSTAGSTRTGTMTEATIRGPRGMPGTGAGMRHAAGGARSNLSSATPIAGGSQTPSQSQAELTSSSGGAAASVDSGGRSNSTVPSGADAAAVAAKLPGIRDIHASRLFGSGSGTARPSSVAHSVQDSNITVRDEPDGYQRSHDGRAPRSTYSVRDQFAPTGGMTPQVLYIPTAMHRNGRAGGAGGKSGADAGADNVPEQLSLLGYSSDMDAFAFNFSVTPASRRIIQDFIANHVKDRSVWYSRDDSEGIAQSITHLMPPGTETSLAMPVFGFDGQVAFAVVACWTDPLYTYPAGALQFVETIAGSLLASVMKEKLHQAERAQLNFAAAASHELRTPLHQINAAAALLRQTLSCALADSPNQSPSLNARTNSTNSNISDMPSSEDVSFRSQSSQGEQDVTVREPKPSGPNGGAPITQSKPARPGPSVLSGSHAPGDTQGDLGTSVSRRILGAEERADAMTQLEMIEANGLALGQILENIIDTLDIGRVTSMMAEGAAASSFPAELRAAGIGAGLPGARAANAAGGVDAGMPGATGDPALVGRMMLVPDSDIKGRRGPKEGDESRIDLSRLLEEVVKQTIEHENKSRRIAGRPSLDKVEIVLEVAPRTRGQWMMATDPGPLIRALSKVIHNACKFTDKGYIHVSMQDASQDVVLPSGFDNSVKLSKVTIDIKDTGCGMTADFLDQKILQPFAKADPFMPGSGLGLNLAQRMINLLGGTLGIDSTHNKGTIVRIEIPLHLYSADNESDQEEVANSQSRSAEHDRALGRPVRQDGVYLYGWDKGPSATKRVGKAIQRQLRLRFCRTVDNARYASLIVVPGEMSNTDIAIAAREAKSGVEVVVLNAADRSKNHPHHQRRPLYQQNSSSRTASAAATASASAQSVPHTSSSTSLHLNSSMTGQEDDLFALVPDLQDEHVVRLSRPLFPSTIRRIMRPPATAPASVEVYKSAVVGGQQATNERLAAAADDQAYAAKRRSSNEQEDVRAGVREASPVGIADAQEAEETEAAERVGSSESQSRQNRSNTGTSTSLSISGDLSASEAAAIRDLAISENLSGAEAAAMQQHGLSRYMSYPSVSLSGASDSGERNSLTHSIDHDTSSVSPSPANLDRQISLQQQHHEQQWQRIQRHHEQQRQNSIAGTAPVEMIVGPEWSSSDESADDEGSSAPSASASASASADANEARRRGQRVARRESVSGSSAPDRDGRRGTKPALMSPPLAQLTDGDREYEEDVEGSKRPEQLGHFLPPLRPPMAEHSSDPNPISPFTFTSASAAVDSSKALEGSVAISHKATKRPALKTAQTTPAIGPEAGMTPAGEKEILKVLVVEDNPVNRKIMCTMLKRAACHFAEAVDGNDAVHVFTTFSPHVVLLDINMPGKDGFEASAEMRKIETQQAARRRARIIAVTALSSEKDKRRGMLECGIDEWKVKPVSMSQLRDDVKAMKI